MGLSYATATVNVAAAATGEIVAAVTGKSIVVHSYILSGDAASTLADFKSAAAAIGGQLRFPANGSIVAGFSPGGHFRTLPGEALNLTATTGAVTGMVRYSLE